MAKLIDGGVVLMTYRGYSNSTSKHLSKVRSAISHKDSVYCYNPNFDILPNLVRDANRLRTWFDVLANKRTRPHTKDNARVELADIVRNARRYCEVLGTTLEAQLAIMSNDPEEEVQDAHDLFAYAIDQDGFDYNKAVKERTERIAKASKKRNAEILRKNKLEVKAWLDGAHNTWALRGELTPVLLRASSDKTQVETTMGAKVSYDAAKRLYLAIKSDESLVGYDIDGYKVIGNEGILTIGCHKIPHDEVERFAASQGWNI